MIKVTKAKPALKILGLLVGLGLFGYIIADAVSKAQGVDWPPLPWTELTLAFVLICISRGLNAAGWVLGARHIAPLLGWVQGVAAYSVSYIGRYLPGKIWQIGGLSYLARGNGANAMEIAGYSLAFLVAFQIVGVLLLLLNIFVQDYSWAPLACGLAAPVIGSALAVIYCFSSEQIFKLLPSSWRERFRGAFDQPVGILTINLTMQGMVWILLSTSAHIIVIGFSPEWTGTWSESTTAVIGGIMVGFLVFIVPSGAGVREAAISVSLTSFGIDPVVSVVIAVALRVAMIAGELVWAALGLLVNSFEQTKKREN